MCPLQRRLQEQRLRWCRTTVKYNLSLRSAHRPVEAQAQAPADRVTLSAACSQKSRAGQQEDGMSDFEQVKSKRRGARQILAKQDVQETIEARVERALAKVKEYESCLRLAWKDYWTDVVTNIIHSLANPSPPSCSPDGQETAIADPKDVSWQSLPQVDSVDGLSGALRNVRITSSSHTLQYASNDGQAKTKTLQSEQRALRSTSYPPHDDQPASAFLQCEANSSIDLPRRILSLGLGKPASDRTAQHQLALLLVLAKDLNVKPEVIEVFDPMWDLADLKVIQELGMTPSPQNLRGIHKLDLESNAYLLYMPHCPRPLYEAILVSNWSQLALPSSRWTLLGNELVDYLSDAQAGRRGGRDGEDDGMTVVKARKTRKSRAPAKSSTSGQQGALERLAPHLSCSALPASPSGMEHSFASLMFQSLPPLNLDKIDWATPRPTAAERAPDEAGEVISRELPFEM